MQAPEFVPQSRAEEIVLADLANTMSEARKRVRLGSLCSRLSPLFDNAYITQRRRKP